MTAPSSHPAYSAACHPTASLASRLSSPAAAAGWAGYLPERLRERMPEASTAVPAFSSSASASSFLPAATAFAPFAQVATAIIVSCPLPCAAALLMPLAIQPAMLLEQQPLVQASRPWWSGRVWALARDTKGCRELQAALQEMTAEDERCAFASEFRGHIAEGLRCPNANFVLQKVIAVLRRENLQPIIDELCLKGTAAVTHVACHKYGCRIIQRLLERCSPEQFEVLLGHLLQEFPSTARHPFGNYAAQHLIAFGSPEGRRKAAAALEPRLAELCSDSFACTVVARALHALPKEDRCRLSLSIFHTPELLEKMARERHSLAVAKLVVGALSGANREVAQTLLRGAVRSSRGALSASAAAAGANGGSCRGGVASRMGGA